MNVPDKLLHALGGTGGDALALDLLVTQQRRRRLLTLRALLDAVAEAPASALPPTAAARALDDWRLLTAAERADPAAARRVVQYPMTGAWAERTLRALAAPPADRAPADRPPAGRPPADRAPADRPPAARPPAGRPPADRAPADRAPADRPPPAAPSAAAPSAATGLAHLGAIAAAAAARAGLRFSADVPVRDGVLTLPTLGSCTVAGRASGIRVAGDGHRLWLHLPAPGADRPADHAGRHPGALRPVEVRRGPDGVWRSAAAGWRPVRALWSDDGRPVLIDDADPYRDEERRSNPYGLTAGETLDAAQHARWRTAWRDAQPWLRLGRGERAQEVAALLDCFVPLAGSPTAHCSATRGEAFGALLSSTPRTGLELAGTLVHELQHTKLLALSGLTVLHTADETPRYWAPWRPDPRPFDGLFQGAYAHLALSGFHLDVARSGAAAPAARDAAWADHCRCRQQVEAALPQLLGSSRLTAQGRTLVTAMAAHHARLKEHAPPEGHLARATAYVETSRVIWRRQSA